MHNTLSQLKILADAIHPLPLNQWEQFASVFRPFTAKRKEMLTLSGEKERYLYFVAEGVQRIYYFDQNGREATIIFTYTPSFGGVLDSMLLNQPSRYYYETLTPSKFLRAQYSELEKIMSGAEDLRTLITIGVSAALSGVMERLVELQCYSAQDRFTSLLKRSPHILQLVPHKYLANYLGIDPTNFSKFINKVKF